MLVDMVGVSSVKNTILNDVAWAFFSFSFQSKSNILLIESELGFCLLFLKVIYFKQKHFEKVTKN